MQVILYNQLHPQRIPNFHKMKEFLEAGDFRSADVKKVGPNLYRARLDISNPTTSLDMPLCMPSCIRHDCLSICLICNVPSCCESHLMDLIERWQPHRSIGAM